MGVARRVAWIPPSSCSSISRLHHPCRHQRSSSSTGDEITCTEIYMRSWYSLIHTFMSISVTAFSQHQHFHRKLHCIMMKLKDKVVPKRLNFSDHKLHSEEVREALLCGSFLLSTSSKFPNISQMLIKLNNALGAFIFLLISF